MRVMDFILGLQTDDKKLDFTNIFQIKMVNIIDILNRSYHILF